MTLNVPGSPPSLPLPVCRQLSCSCRLPPRGRRVREVQGRARGPEQEDRIRLGWQPAPPPARVPRSRAVSLGLPGEAGPALLSLGGLAPEADPWGCGSINSCPGLIRCRFCLRCTWKPRLVDTGLSLRVRLRGARLDLCDRARVCFGRKGLGYVYKAGRRRAVPGFGVRGPLLELCGTGPEDPAVGRLALSWPEGAPRGAVCLLRAAGTSGASSSERHLLSS